VFDGSTSARLSALGAANVVRASDNLVVGPSRLDAREHARLRAAWWGSPERWDQLYDAGVRWELPIVVWASASPADRVNLWRTCHWLSARQIQHRDVFLLELPRREAFDCAETVSSHPDAILIQRLGVASPSARARLAHLVSLWRKYVDADLSRFAQACTASATPAPDLAAVWAALSTFLPRSSASGTMLSRFDTMLLRTLSREWQTPVDVYVSGPDEWQQAVHCTGDLFVLTRLEQWADHGPPFAVERTEGPQPQNPMRSRVFRVTSHGERLREGLGALTDAPRLPLAGIEAYAQEAPWILREPRPGEKSTALRRK
jgi:hypothetical protein